MLELRIKTGRRSLPLFDLPAALGRHQAAKQVADAIDGLIAFLDDLGGDPDIERTDAEDDFVDHPADGPGCPIADTGEDGDQDCCGARDDIGTEHVATHKIGFDRRHGGLECEDAETSWDKECIDEREPDDADHGYCQHYGVDQTKPLDAYLGQPVPIDALC